MSFDTVLKEYIENLLKNLPVKILDELIIGLKKTLTVLKDGLKVKFT